MSENSGHDTHPFGPAAQKIPQASLPGGNGVHPIPNPRHNSIYSVSNEPSNGDLIMSGVNVGEQGHYNYQSAPSSTPRTAYPNGVSNSVTSHKWAGSYYQINQYTNHHSEPEHTRHITSPIASSHGAQYPQVAHTWDQTRSSQRSQPSLQDQNYPQHRNLYNNNPSYGRPPHHPVEPTATAPSPPNPYPSSPRTPQTGAGQLPSGNGLVLPPGHKQPLSSIGSVSSIASMNSNIHQQELQEQRREYRQNSNIDNHQQHHQGSNQGTFVDSLHDSSARFSPSQTNRLLSTGGARRSSGMEMRVDGRDRTNPHPFSATTSANPQSNYYYNNSSPLSPGSKIGTSLNETIHPGRYQYNGTQNGGFRHEVNKGANERANSGDQHQYHLEGPEPQFAVLQRPGAIEVRKASLQKISNGHKEPVKNQHNEDTDEEDGIKRESISRTASASVSPTATRSMLPGASTRRDSIDSNASASSGKEGSKKRGGPVFTDHNGRQYYEEDVVPPGVEVPSGWQLGLGKKCLNKLLPLFKDGLPVFPEWGLTSAGKARQRLPKACASCRTKKIKCVESDQDDSKCAHCHKMRIPCSQDDEEKPARKNSKKISDKKKRKDGAMGLEAAVGGSASPGVNGAQGGFGFPKKRKASDDGQKSNGGFLKRGKSSRDSSFSMEPIEEKVDAMDSSVDGAQSTTFRHHQQSQTQMPAQSQKRWTFATDPGSASMNVTDEGRTSRNYNPRKLVDQYSSGGYGVAGVQPMSGATPNSFTSASPTTSDHPAIYGMNNSYSSGPKALSATPTIMETPPAPYPSYPIGEDPRGSTFPPRHAVLHLAEMYFKYVYSQTYAFLHKKTFMSNLDKQPPVLILSLCTVAARFSTHYRHMEETYAEQARQLILQNFDNYCLEVVQSMIHMGLHDFGSNKGDKAWMFCGMAVRMGSALNLNLENGRAKINLQSPIERESARRTYWSYYLMDRFNGYGVARPFLTQDHDCHVQLPCNQPSFRDGQTVVTEHLLGPNPAKPEVGTIHMGAMAFLVRVVGIWGNILKQIHLSGFDKKKDKEADFQALIEHLETWRKSLPDGLEYSNENLAGQISVGTAGAFVTMHVMWHTAMAYVHRYVRIITKVEVTDKSGQSIPDQSIITSIRKTFVHADAVLLIMTHVQQRRKKAIEMGETEVIVNAPFLGQAISDACDISIIRALELKGDPGNAMKQKERIHVGLTWLKELRMYWVPLEGMYRKLRKAYRKVDRIIQSQAQAGRMSNNNVIPSPDSGNGSEMITDYQMFQFPIDPATYELNPDMGMGGLSAPEALGPQQWDFLPEIYYEEAFAGTSGLSLYGIAEAEGGFPQLYMDQHVLRDDMGMATSLAPGPDVSYQHAILGSAQMPLIHHQSFTQLPHHTSDLDDSDDDDDDDDGKEGVNNVDEQSITSSKKREKAKSHLSTLYFHPSAVLDGKLGDSSGSESSGLNSRRQSEAVPKPEHNRMDVLHLLVSPNVTQRVSKAVESRDESDLGTGRQGVMVPKDDVVKGEVNTDNSKGHGLNN